MKGTEMYNSVKTGGEGEFPLALTSAIIVGLIQKKELQ